MAFEGQQITIPGLICGAVSLATKQYRAVKLSGDNSVIICAAATDVPIGILQNKPGIGEEATVCAIGVTKIDGDADLDAGNLISTSSDGQLQVSASTDYTCGQVIQGNTAAGGYATALVNFANLIAKV